LGISNNISLENLSIKKDVLWKFHIPMYILDGKIGRINIRVYIVESLRCPSTTRREPATW
jgi:N-terminal region of Chorein or VPS13